jgi:alkanesulfonate monooxygenase SsuD/methylene tetrahydromethanopterin reductase-like flavin-dependent oxidoreductase (luciferase family)
MLKFGYLLPTRDAVAAGRPGTGPLLDLARTAEAAAFDSLWVGDSPMARPRHEPLTLLAATAAVTERVQLGTAVLLATLRSPLLLAHEAATLDVISDGRLILGVGAGFALPATEQQSRAFDVPYRGRFGRFEETIEILRRTWASRGEPVSFDGRHFQLDGAQLPFEPAQPGGPPLWLPGSSGAALDRAGSLADGWLPYIPSAAAYAAALERVAAAAAAAARPVPTAGLYVTLALDEDLRAGVERYYGYPLEAVSQVQAMRAGAADELCEWLQGYIEAGAKHIVLRVVSEQPHEALEAVAELVVSRLRPAIKEAV